MKILLVQNMLYVPTLNGAAKSNQILIEGLAEKNHSCRVVTLAISPHSHPSTRAEFLGELANRGIRLISSSFGVDAFHHRGVEVHAVTDGSMLPTYVMNQICEFEPTWTLVSSNNPGHVLLEAALKASPSRVVFWLAIRCLFRSAPNALLRVQPGRRCFGKQLLSLR